MANTTGNIAIIVNRTVISRGAASTRRQRDKLVLVPKTPDCFRALVKLLKMNYPSKGIAFHTYSLLED